MSTRILQIINKKTGRIGNMRRNTDIDGKLLLQCIIGEDGECIKCMYAEEEFLEGNWRVLEGRELKELKKQADKIYKRIEEVRI